VFSWLAFLWMAWLADAIIVFTDRQKKEIAGKFFIRRVEKISVAKHPNYIGYYPDGPGRDEARKKLGIQENQFVYMCFGIIRPYKGVLEFMRIFKKQRGLNDLLLIVGSATDSMAEQINSEADSSVRLALRNIPDDEISLFFQAADICVFPFRDITNSGSLILALSLGKPVIAPRKGGVVEIVKPEFGLLYDDDSDLKEVLNKAKALDLEEMGRAGLKEVAKYSWVGFAKDYRDVYCKLFSET